MFKKRKDYTNKEIADGILNFVPKIYRYLDDEYRQKTIDHVRRNSGSKQDGEDHFQDVVCEIYETIKKGKYDSEKGAFGGYFMDIVKKRWIDTLRKRQRALQTFSLDDEGVQQITDPDAIEIGSEALSVQRANVVAEHMEKLSEEEREILSLRYFKGLPLKDIAVRLNITYEALRVRIHRIVKKLRESIGNDPQFSSLFK